MAQKKIENCTLKVNVLEICKSADKQGNKSMQFRRDMCVNRTLCSQTAANTYLTKKDRKYKTYTRPICPNMIISS